jgi:inhibitor of cysteine peptidase
MSIIRKSSFRRAQLAVLAILAISTVALAAGCASKKSVEPVAVPPAGTRENGVLVLSDADNNRSADLRVGERCKVGLPENPSTGYTWAIDETDGRLLALNGTEYAEPTEGFIGARGRRIFTFTARQPGEVILRLKYWRFWDGEGSTTERYTVTLKIAP